MNKKDARDEVTNALVVEHFEQVLNKNQLPLDTVTGYVPALVASPILQEQVNACVYQHYVILYLIGCRIVRESEAAGEYGIVRKKNNKVIATSYHYPAPLWTPQPLVRLPRMDIPSVESTTNPLWIAAAVHIGMRYLKIIRK